MVRSHCNVFDNSKKSFFSSRSQNISNSKGVLTLEISLKKDEITTRTTGGDINQFDKIWLLSIADLRRLLLSSFSLSVIINLSCN